MLYNDYMSNGTIEIFSRILNAAGTSIQNLNPQGTLVDFSSFAPAKIQISSSNAVDNAGGTGARAALLIGLGPNFEKQTEIIPFNGQAASVSTKTFTRVFAMKVATAGSGKTNAGIIYASRENVALTSGAPAVAEQWLNGPAGDGIATNGLFTIPAGKTGIINSVWFFNTAQIAEVSLWIQKIGVWSQISFVRMSATGPQVEYRSPIKLPEYTDIQLRLRSNTAGAFASARMIVRV